MIHHQLKQFGFNVELIVKYGSALESNTYLAIEKDGKVITLGIAATHALKEQIIEFLQMTKGMYSNKKERKKQREHGYSEIVLSETLQKLIDAEEYEKANDIKEAMAKLIA